MSLKDRITHAALAINEGRTKVLNSSEGMAIVEVIGRQGDAYIATVSVAGCTCQCPWGRNTPWGWSNPCYHALAAAGAVDIDVPLNDTTDHDHEEVNT